MTDPTLPPHALAAAALPDTARCAQRVAIDAAWRTPEPECVPVLTEAARLSAEQQAHAQALAHDLVVGLRASRSHSSGVDALMKEFSLSSQEGVALMCLAEALLRVPDKATADRLIRDKLAKGDWRAHLGQSPSLFVNAATWGLLITGRLVSTSSEEGLSSALNRMLARGGEPLIRKGMDLAMRMLGEQFVTGRNIEEALKRGRAHEKNGYRYSFDMLGEAATTAADAAAYLAAYEHAIHAIGQSSAGRGVVDGNGISVKLSALHPRYQWAQRERVMSELYPRLLGLCELARRYDIGLNIDAEEADRLDLSLDVLEALALDPRLNGWAGLGFVVQAYQKRATQVLDFVIELARRSARRIMVRLVKGAYWDAEIKRAQVDGLAGYPVFTRKVYTDVSYLACARKLLAARAHIYPQFATHNAHTLAAILQLAGAQWQVGDYEFQCLHGMGEPLYDQIVGHPQRHRLVRIYAPVGSHETLLAYLVRRLLENGANTSFVNRIVDERVPIESLIADPVEQAERLQGAPHPRIPLPVALYGATRANAIGFDLASEPLRHRLAQALAHSRTIAQRAAPMLACDTPAADGTAMVVTNPARNSDRVGEVIEASLEQVDQALQAASAAAPRWAATPASERSRVLRTAADRLESNADQLLALIVREAGKSWPNAVAELREAVDFCRYYADQAQEFDPLSHPALGPALCISPWNFPLAIFTGQIAAALAAGNPVLAKPAEQTPLIAAMAVRLMHQAGVPTDVLQLLPGRGESVGAALVADPRVAAVMFTGSTEVARLINRQLAQREGQVPLIAETGGQNAMIVDSTALAEQVVVDVIASSFDSAGQRCSALRVLCLQQDIADKVLEMLRGALDELLIGDPADMRVDVGPVIDADARASLEAHVSAMQAKGFKVTRLPLPEHCNAGTYVAPTIIEIDSLADLGREQFGPILHVIRYPSTGLDALIDAINGSGYGLTMGVHTRINETIDRVSARAHVGNLYVNRNIIGAVVGVQPFGGEGLSGTGPKAGGPLYLHRLLQRSPGPDLQLGAVAVAGRTDDARLQSFEDWLDGPARSLLEGDELLVLRDRLDHYRAHPVTGLKIVLPGPTGEDNQLSFVARGTVAGVASTLAGAVHQLLAAIASGNRIVMNESPAAHPLRASLPAALQSQLECVRDWDGRNIGAVLFDGDAQQAGDLRIQLAARHGPILSLLQATPHYDLSRLVHERTVSVNTTAAGGNASLMVMGD